MKALFIFPPQWMPINPHLGVSILSGQFKDSPHEASCLDLNIDFYNKILTSENIYNSFNLAKSILINLREEVNQLYDKNIKFESYPIEWQIKIAKYHMIKENLKKYEKSVDKISAITSKNIAILKSKESFYNPKQYRSALEQIDVALDICSMPYYPTRIMLSNYINKLLNYDYKLIKHYVFDKTTNIFRDYFENKLFEIKSENVDYIGISINSANQIIAGLTLANMLKTETNAHISIGGNHFTRVVDSIQKYPEFFDIFCDSVSVEEGEIPVLELARHIAGEIPVEKVPNLLYLKNNKVICNLKAVPLKLNDIKPPSLKGFTLNEYFTPEIVMPIQSSRGCYWHKCSFCDHDFGLNYNTKNLDKLIEEIKIFKKQYNITKFEFVDAAISPSILKAMSKRFIEEELNITFFCDARTESGFTKEIFELACKAGLKMILWGFESGAPKIMKLINKGVDIDNRLKVLRYARDAGIYNFIFIILGFPTETREDALLTINTICNNTDIIGYYGANRFSICKHTNIKEEPKKYGILNPIYQKEEFIPSYIYEPVGMNKKELDDIFTVCASKTKNAYGNALQFHIFTREMMLLYLDKYGIDYVCNYKYNF